MSSSTASTPILSIHDAPPQHEIEYDQLEQVTVVRMNILDKVQRMPMGGTIRDLELDRYEMMVLSDTAVLECAECETQLTDVFNRQTAFRCHFDM